MKTKNFKVGNIVLSPYNSKSVEIIVEIKAHYKNKHELSFTLIPIDSTQCSIFRSEFTHFENSQNSCTCYESDDNSNFIEDCENCHGTGIYQIERLCMDRTKFLASTIKEYIMSRLLKNFEFYTDINP